MQVRLPCKPTSARLARELTKEHLETLGQAHRADVATLLVSELVTNALLHASTPMELDVSCRDGAVVVAVADGCERLPRVSPDGDDELTSGRGLLLLDTLAAEWGSDSHASGGKTVWFMLKEY